MNTHEMAAFSDELQKIAARAGLRLIKRLVEKGSPAAMEEASRLARAAKMVGGGHLALEGTAAERLAQMRAQGKAISRSSLARSAASDAGVIKRTAPGSQIRELGEGGEGLATLVADREHGVAVRKLYNPGGLSGSEMIQRKLDLAEKVKGNPLFAETYGYRGGVAPGGKLKREMTFHEYVKPTKLPDMTPEEVQKAFQAKGIDLPLDRIQLHMQNPKINKLLREHASTLGLQDQIRQAGRDVGVRLADVRGANIVGGKAIDVLPMKPGEVISETGGGLLGNMLKLTPSGGSALHAGQQSGSPFSKKEMYEKLLGKSFPGKVVPSAPAAPIAGPATGVVKRKPLPLSSASSGPSSFVLPPRRRVLPISFSEPPLIRRPAPVMSGGGDVGSGALAGGLVGGTLGAGAGYLGSDDKHKLRNTLLGGLAGAGSGAFIGSAAAGA